MGYFGTVSFLALAALGLGGDDDDFIQITGGYLPDGIRGKGREKIMPKYTIRIGGFDIPYKYLIPLAPALLIIGTINDELRWGDKQNPEWERIALSLFVAMPMMIKDMTFVESISDLLDWVTSIANPGTEETAKGNFEKIGRLAAEKYGNLLLAPSPLNWNITRQIEQIIDPTAYSRKEIIDVLSYISGLHHFTGYPKIDLFGEEAKTYLGETMIPWTFWTNIRGKDKRYKFLQDHDALPNPLTNAEILIDKGERTLTTDEYYHKSIVVGEKFAEYIEEYMENTALVEADMIAPPEYDGKFREITGVQQRVALIREYAMTVGNNYIAIKTFREKWDNATKEEKRKMKAILFKKGIIEE